ncbi:MAG: hypothetical protein WCA49_12565 [Candidatus Sulfotelmatobacter sp.]
MKSGHFSISVVLLALALMGGSSFANVSGKASGDKEVYTGIVGDSMCGTKHMKDTSDADCIHMCIKHGFDYALVIGDKVYTLKGDKDQIDKVAGRQVKVTGTLSGDAITVESIEPVGSK